MYQNRDKKSYMP